jgi:hypothetical protein
MGDLVVAILALVLGAVLGPFGAPAAVAAAVSTAATLIWPGYIAIAALWPERRQMGAAQRLALIPLLSILASAVIGLILWVLIPATTAPLVHAGTLVIGLASAIWLGVWRWRHNERMHRDVLVGSCCLFVVLAVAVGMAVAVPQSIGAKQPVAIYLDPAVKPASNSATDSIDVPLVLTGVSAQARLSAEVSGQIVATQLVYSAPSALRITLAVPRAALSANETRAVDIRLKSVVAPEDQIVQLRLQLKP